MSPKPTFKIPTVEQVAAYMKEKKPDWPGKFIEYYAAKFWDHYQSVGWRISGRSMMKDFQAAFRAQWQHPKYDEDIKMLNALRSENKPQTTHETIGGKMDKTVQWLDEALNTYVKHPTEVPAERLAACYDWMKERGLIKLTPEQKQIAKDAGKDNIVKGKAVATQFVFNAMANRLKTFAQILK